MPSFMKTRKAKWQLNRRVLPSRPLMPPGDRFLARLPNDPLRLKNPHWERGTARDREFPERGFDWLSTRTPEQRKEHKKQKKEFRASDPRHDKFINASTALGAWMVPEVVWFGAIVLEFFLDVQLAKNFLVGLTGKYYRDRKRNQREAKTQELKEKLQEYRRRAFDYELRQMLEKEQRQYWREQRAKAEARHPGEPVDLRTLDNFADLNEEMEHRIAVTTRRMAGLEKGQVYAARELADALDKEAIYGPVVDRQQHTDPETETSYWIEVRDRSQRDTRELDADDEAIAANTVVHLAQQAAYWQASKDTLAKGEVLKAAVEHLGDDLFHQITGRTTEAAKREYTPDGLVSRLSERHFLNATAENSSFLRKDLSGRQAFVLAALEVLTKQTTIQKDERYADRIADADPHAAIAIGVLQSLNTPTPASREHGEAVDWREMRAARAAERFTQHQAGASPANPSVVWPSPSVDPEYAHLPLWQELGRDIAMHQEIIGVTFDGGDEQRFTVQEIGKLADVGTPQQNQEMPILGSIARLLGGSASGRGTGPTMSRSDDDKRKKGPRRRRPGRGDEGLSR